MACFYILGGDSGTAQAALCNGAIIATACIITFIMTLLAA